MNDKEHIELLTRIDERQKAMATTLENILDEAKKTNGRVTTLEQNQSNLKTVWRTLTVVGTIIGFILGFLL